MSVKQFAYETLLTQYSDRDGAIALLRQYRPYLEMIPSLRRPLESVLVLPLPVARIRTPKTGESSDNRFTPNTATQLPCDLAVLMCDPEWKVKMGPEIVVFIHRPHEDFSDLLMRWRQTQMYLDKDYEWLMPHFYEDILCEGTDKLYPLFVLSSDSPSRILKGLAGAHLPYVVQSIPTMPFDDEPIESLTVEDGLEIEEWE
ncbi:MULTISPECIES: hypothetical protein [Spirulina sp. CCY15215]|uniref:hypothetical protein n=1 Tax=Spirulina sp. CCY15215 TaxID=2767591 RepID=UPI00194F4AD0|nr:hypothetical protein [Spirulina major]